MGRGEGGARPRPSPTIVETRPVSRGEGGGGLGGAMRGTPAAPPPGPGGSHSVGNHPRGVVADSVAATRPPASAGYTGGRAGGGARRLSSVSGWVGRLAAAPPPSGRPAPHPVLPRHSPATDFPPRCARTATDGGCVAPPLGPPTPAVVPAVCRQRPGGDRRAGAGGGGGESRGGAGIVVLYAPLPAGGWSARHTPVDGHRAVARYPKRRWPLRPKRDRRRCVASPLVPAVTAGTGTGGEGAGGGNASGSAGVVCVVARRPPGRCPSPPYRRPLYGGRCAPLAMDGGAWRSPPWGPVEAAAVGSGDR